VILEAIQVASANTSRDGLLIVFFAGHGLTNESGFFLCTETTTRNELAATSISNAALDEVISASPASGVLLIFDCCQSAGFAERTPSFFRGLSRSEFRLLLAASRADEQVWEFADTGTLFAAQLLNALRGEVVVGNTPGLIYFSDLVRHLQSGISEALETRFPSTPRQDPVVAGVQTKDPLLFVHGALTLSQVAVRTARYSRAYIFRLLVRIFGITAALVFFLLGSYWTLLEHSEFVEPTDRALVVWAGIPGYSAFAFPRRLWELDVPRGAARDGSSLEQGRTLSAVGRPVFPAISPLLQPEYRALVLHWMQRDTEARRAMWEALSNLKQVPEVAPTLPSTLVEELTASDDLPTLEHMAQSGRRDIRLAAVVAILRIDPERGIAGARAFMTNSGGWITMERDHIESSHLLESLNGRCIPGLRDLLRDAITKVEYYKSQDEIVEPLLRLGCRLTVEEVLAQHLSGSPYDGEDVGWFAMITGLKDLSPTLIRLLDQPVRIPDQPYLDRNDLVRNFSFKALSTLRVLPGDTCDSGLWHSLSDHPIWADKDVFLNSYREGTTAVLADRCPEFRVWIRSKAGSKWLMDQPPEVFAVLGHRNLIGSEKVISRFNALRADSPTDLSVEQQTKLIDALQFLPSEETTSALLTVLTTMWTDRKLNETLGEHVLDVLRLLDVPSDDAVQVFQSPVTKWQIAAYRWYARRHAREAADLLHTRLGESSALDIPEALGAIILPPADDARLCASVASELETKPVLQVPAAVVLAMRGDSVQLRRVLTYPSAAVRRAAREYAAFNAVFTDSFVAGLKWSYPDESQIALRRQIEIRHRIQNELRDTPTLARAWRARLIAGTSRELGPGLKHRLTDYAESPRDPF
jgi:hypothetical protein